MAAIGTDLEGSMRAARMAERGGPEEIVIESVAIPTLRSGDALIAVHAAAITPSELGWEPTWTHPDGSPRTPVIPSHEVAGVVVALGPDVTEPLVGTRVFALTDFFRDGAAAAYVAVKAGDLADWPTTLDAVEVAALPLSGLTAWQALFDQGHLVAGQSVLIHGAAGGVGSFAIQLAHGIGAHVTAIVSGRDAGLVRDLGADRVVERAPGPFPIADGSIDVVLDTVGGDVLDRSWPVLTPSGRLVSIAPSSREIADQDPRGHFFVVSPERGELTELAHLLERGDLRVVIERTFSLDEARQAYEFGQQEHPRGKVVLRVRS